MPRISVNGIQEEVPPAITIKGLLESKKINPNVVACELNLSIIKRAKLGETVLNDGDTLEIIQMIGGG